MLKRILLQDEVKELEQKGKATFLPYGNVDKYFLMANGIVYYYSSGAYHFLAKQEDVYKEFIEKETNGH